MVRLARNRWSYWIRGIMYGAASSLAMIVVIALIVAAVRDEYPINHYKGAPMRTIGIARTVVAPVAVPIGAAIGLGLTELLWRRRPA